jgi:hypothetical protein
MGEGKRDAISLDDCYRLADLRSDAGDGEASRALNFAACTAEEYRRKLKKLAWACLEKNRAKRVATLKTVRMELEAAGESAADLPCWESVT